jgi:phenylalanyl-tRNA synthetase beta chain
MRAPLTWLREYVAVPPDATAEDVAAALVRVGLEEEAVHGGDVTGPLVVGRVVEFTDEPQRNGKVIRWCSVDVGPHNNADGTYRGIVCGARNFAAGDLVVACLPGACLPGGFAISARRTYGHVSDGMICSARELGLGDDHDGIIRLAEWDLPDAEPGADALPLLGLDERTIEVNVTPDRGYCLSLRGIAREYAHATGAAFTDPAARQVPPATADGFAVRLDDGAPVRGARGCSRYVARVVRGVDAANPSPPWMRRRLDAAGMRPISLAVDVTNYVMLALGQPLHAFDLAGLVEPVVVRRARSGEKLTTLDDVPRDLDPEDLLITDSGGDRVLALAGVMGGASSEVTATTRDVLIEAACFDWVTVARTARRHKLSTEASRRFERGVDTGLAAAAADYAVQLLVEFGGGAPGPVTDADERAARPPLRMPWTTPNRVVGCRWSRQEVTATLTEIGCTVTDDGDDLVVETPSWRPDLTAGVHLAEEVARLRGYEHIPSVLPVAPAGRGLTHGQRSRRSVARALAEHGLVEVLSYPFVSPSVHDAMGLGADDTRRRAVRLANPLSAQAPQLRTSMLPPLLETLRRNVGRGQSDLGLFEVGLVVAPGGPREPLPRPPAATRPDDATLAAIEASVPLQPRHVGVVLAGQREIHGWTGPGRAADWTDAVEAAEIVASTLGLELIRCPADRAPWHPGRCARLELADGALAGFAGELHPKAVAALGLPRRTVAAELDLDVLIAASGGVTPAAPVSTFPVVKEDVALIVDARIPAAAVEAALREGAGELLESIRLFDVYEGPQIGEGRTSLAFALRMRAPDRTLTAAESAAVRDAAVARAVAATRAVLRSV